MNSLNQLLTADMINIVDKISDWSAAIELVAQPLIDKNIVTPNYINAIFASHAKLGPYYVLAPKIAMPHARPEEGALDIGVSLLVVREGVNFQSQHNDPVYLVLMLAAKDAESHLGLLQQLAELFSAEKDVDMICLANSTENILSIISRY